MDLGNQRASGNVEDRRGMGMVGGGLGIGGIAVAVVAYFLGFDPGTALQIGQQVSTGTQQQHSVPSGSKRGTPEDQMGQFVARVLGSTEDVWSKLLNGYRAPTLVLYDRQTPSACGMGQSAMGPFYCPNDEKLYVDLSFYRDLQNRFHAPGDFAQAYVIAHEVGHHVQKLTGTFRRMQAASPADRNRVSVRMELQADCYAGVWGHHAGAMKQLSPGDVEEALKAATAIGDDRLQQQTQGRVVPESFTHGTSAQRVHWFTVGMQSGRPQDCDTFSAAKL
jgi:predicted metalloprotease